MTGFADAEEVKSSTGKCRTADCCCCWKRPFNLRSDWLKVGPSSPTTSTALSQLIDESSSGPDELVGSIPCIKLLLEASRWALVDPPLRNLCLPPDWPWDWPEILLRCWVSHSARRLARSTWIPLRANFFCCFSSDLSSFFSFRSRSLRSNSSAGIGSPEHVCGCALWAGRPGPFFVCSFLRHFARLFWNQTFKKPK